MDRSTSASSSAAEPQRAAPPGQGTLGGANWLIIVGASARAAAFSALSGGWSPWCADLFADVDLQAKCPAQVVNGYPHALADVVNEAPAGGWMYTGGLENHPRLVDRIADQRPLLGNPGSVLRKVRDPVLLAETLTSAGLNAGQVCRHPDNVPTDGTWLVKRVDSAGGSGVRVWRGDDPPPRRAYYQQRIIGRPCAGVFLADGRRALLLGVTEQLVGTDWLNARPFHYAGSLGPLDLGPALADEWSRIGTVLAEQFGLVGLFGVDAVVRDGRVWPVEVNPRFPASVEVLERAGGFSAVTWHVAACQRELPAAAPTFRAGWQGKGIVFAGREGAVTRELLAHARTQNAQCPQLAAADLPAVASQIPAGRPILTVFAGGATRDQLVQRLQQQRELFASHLEPVFVRS